LMRVEPPKPISGSTTLCARLLEVPNFSPNRNDALYEVGTVEAMIEPQRPDNP